MNVFNTDENCSFCGRERNPAEALISNGVSNLEVKVGDKGQPPASMCVICLGNSMQIVGSSMAAKPPTEEIGNLMEKKEQDV